MPKIITTSWDDGHPKDFLISELLNKYRLKGTFYIPKNNPENEVMNEEQLVTLSKDNEVGGHTLNHVRLTAVNGDTMEAEVAGCYNWLKELLQTDPESFCFPLGAYDSKVITCVQKAGFRVARTTELLSVDTNKPGKLLATTLQVYERPDGVYLKHLLKRFKLNNLFLWMRSSSDADLLKLTDFYINHILKHDGCFHLWGHSWEIEQFGLWSKLELVFKHIAGIPEFTYLWNKELIQEYH